jgi:CubicO group peptidase (beta-lactamase class C family)
MEGLDARAVRLREALRAVCCLALALLLTITACGIAPPGPEPAESITYQPVDREDGWSISTPAEQGLDPRVVSRAFSEAGELGQIRSLLIVKNGYLVAEEYFNGQQWDRTNNVASVTKSYLSALVGIALEEGYLTSLDQKMMDYFPEYASPGLDQNKYNITIRQLLQMRAGYPFDSTDAYYARLMKSGNYMRFIIEEHPLVNTPGSEWNYSSASAHLLSGILTKAVGMPLVKFATKSLFDPLDIDIRTWERDPQGYYMGGAEMAYISRDMAKFGVLYLRNGAFGEQQVIPSEWIEESLQAYSLTNYGNLGYFKKICYGYLWWSAKVGKYKVNFAWGHGGQFIVIVPELDMVVVTTANPYLAAFDDEAWQSEKSIMDLIGRYISRTR